MNKAVARDIYLSRTKSCFKIALIIIAITLIAVIILLIVSGGSFNENDGGAVWWFLAPLSPFFYIILPITLIIGTINGILYLKNK